MKINLYNIPSVDQYVNQLIASYITIQSQFSQGDILLADKINHLQQKSRYMIKSIDEFMNKNALDCRVRYLYSARNKLSKFLFKINDNQLVKNVNQMRQNESVFETSMVNKRRQDMMSNQKENQYYQQSRRNDINSDNNNDQRVVFEDVNESFESIPGKRLQLSNKYNQNNRDSQVKPYSIQQSTPQQKQPLYKHIPKNNSIVTGHNRTQTTRMKPYQQQHEKEKFQPSYYEHRDKSRTPVKTSRKVQSFTPRNTNVSTSARQQQQNSNEQNYLQKPHTSRQQQQQLRSDNKKSTPTIITPRTRITSNNNYVNNDHVIERTPTNNNNSNHNNGFNNNSSLSLSNKKSSNKDNNNQSFVANNNSSFMQRINDRQSHLYQQRQTLFTPRKQQQQINSVRPSSAMKSLANLIFTIKMTKQEYNQFKKIKQLHQGHNSKINNSYIRQ